ncbi:MAG: histidine kinase [Chitinophagaceae bacterium]
MLSFGTWKTYYAYLKQKEITELEKERFDTETERLLLANEKLHLQKNLANAEVRYLKAQVNPHFIYNTLNYLYNGLEGLDDDRAEALLLLSDILRYNLTDIPKSGKVPLVGEIKNIETLVRLARLRFGNKCYIEIKKNGDLAQVQLLPMVLGTLVENIFKHGDITDSATPALIYVQVSDGMLTFRTRNKTKASLTKDDRPQSGLAFARKRLEDFYRDDFLLESRDGKGIFETKLKIYRP